MKLQNITPSSTINWKSGHLRDLEIAKLYIRNPTKERERTSNENSLLLYSYEQLKKYLK